MRNWPLVLLFAIAAAKFAIIAIAPYRMYLAKMAEFATKLHDYDTAPADIQRIQAWSHRAAYTLFAAVNAFAVWWLS